MKAILRAVFSGNPWASAGAGPDTLEFKGFCAIVPGERVLATRVDESGKETVVCLAEVMTASVSKARGNVRLFEIPHNGTQVYFERLTIGCEEADE